MNLKQAFYKDYYQGIDFRKYTENDGVASGKETRIENNNERQFKENNQPLFNYQFQTKDFTAVDLSSYQLKGYDIIPLATIYPGLVTGLGMVHETNNKAELKLGFFFDHTSGMPMLPGSGVKGALRGAFPQFKKRTDNSILPNLTDDKALAKKQAKAEFIGAIFPPFKELIGADLHTKVHQLELAIFEGVNIAKKAKKPKEDHYLPIAKRCRFFDAIIASTNNDGNKILGIDALTPHGKNALKNPIPLPFMKVLPGVVFNFQFVLQSLEIDEQFKITAAEIKALFKAILLQLGVGAKTNVGYGQFTEATRGRTQNGDQRGSRSQGNANYPRWEEVIPRKTEHQLKKDNRLDGIINRIEGDYAYIRFTENGETGEIRKKFNVIRDINRKKLTAITQLEGKTAVLIKIQKDYIYGDKLTCQVQLTN